MREAETGNVEGPSLESILDKAKQLFLSKETYDPTTPKNPKHGKTADGFTFTIASGETVDDLVESGVNMRALAGKLMLATSATPYDPSSLEGETWEEISRLIVNDIIRSEMPLRFPHLVAENKRREDIYIEY